MKIYLLKHIGYVIYFNYDSTVGSLMGLGYGEGNRLDGASGEGFGSGIGSGLKQ